MADEPQVDAVRKAVPRVLEAIATEPWAITEAGLTQIVAIAERENAVTPEALEAYAAKRVAGADNMQVRGSVAIIPVSGPIFRYASFFTSISAAATTQGIARDLTMAIEDPSIRAVLFHWDTPGGEVNGISELAAMIRVAATRKPVESYVGGACCSAGYWLASSTSRITISRTAELGSIGVRVGIRDSSERDAKSGVRNFEFISSKAPNKRLDLSTDEGRARIQRRADSLEAVFIAEVAANRGRTDDYVVLNFGGGGVEIGADAVKVGLADALGSFESVLARMGNGNGAYRGRSTIMEAITQAQLDKAVADARAEGVAEGKAAGIIEGKATGAAEAQARISAILGSEEAKDRPTLAAHLAMKTATKAEDAIATLAVSAKETKAAPAGTQASGQRSQDAADGLALSALETSGKGNSQAGNDGGEGGQKKPAIIDTGAIYGNRAKVMAGAR